MKQFFENHRVEIVECPRCGAICKVGNDDDGQVYCAACRVTFKPSETQEITVKEYNEMLANAKETHMVSGWEAFVK